MSSTETTRVVNLPIDLELRNRETRRRVEATVQGLLGPEWECLWPVPGAPFTGAIKAVNTRPGQRYIKLENVKNESQGRDVVAQLPHGLTLVEFFPKESRAVAAALDAATVRLRDDLAMLWGWKDPWVLELAIGWGDYRGIPFIEDVVIVRSGPIDAEKRRDAWLNKIRDVLPTMPGFVWRYEQGETPTEIRLVQVQDRLNEIIRFDEDVSTLIDPTTPWHVGVDDEGESVDLDIAGSAHLLVAGATRSGKSVSTYGLVTHILRMGGCARLLIADPNDTTVAPFESKVAWSSTSTHPAEITKMLQWVRREMDRRKPVLRAMRRDKLDTFTADLPLIVIIIDEAANYLRHSDKKAVADLTGELMAVVSQGAKYGIRCILITQRPSSDVLNTTVRAQLSARLCFRVEDKETAMMAFPDLEDPEVLLTCEPGVGYVKEVAGRARRFRSVFLEDHWAVADALTYSQPKIDIEKRFIAGRSEFEVIAPERDLGVMDFELDES
jgi:DNA segregation ATPase FtsK/SpoIIIE-like protein